MDVVTKEEKDTYRWLVDRFTKTYLNNWAKGSHYLEWRYLHAELVAPCSSVEMRQRRIADGDVSKAFAKCFLGVQAAWLSSSPWAGCWSSANALPIWLSTWVG